MEIDLLRQVWGLGPWAVALVLLTAIGRKVVKTRPAKALARALAGWIDHQFLKRLKLPPQIIQDKVLERWEEPDPPSDDSWWPFGKKYKPPAKIEEKDTT